MKRFRFALALLATGLAAQNTKTAAPPTEELPPPIQVNVEVVNVLCSVRDKHNGLINNLNKDDFQLSENGKAQTIKYFTRETDLPLTIGLLVDVSNSQGRLIEIERRAASSFFDAVLRPKDEAFLISFGADSELLQDVTTSKKMLREGLDAMKLNGGFSGIHPGPVPTASTPRGTVLYDAVYLAGTDVLSKEAGRKVIVIITDGVDQGSKLNIAQAVESAQKSDAVIYSIYYVDNQFYGGGFTFGGGEGYGKLKRMSEETGGRVLQVDRHNTLEEIFRQIQDEMRSQYAIGYTPNESRQLGEYRKIDLRTTNHELKVQARKGYYVVKPE